MSLWGNFLNADFILSHPSRPILMHNRDFTEEYRKTTGAKTWDKNKLKMRPSVAVADNSEVSYLGALYALTTK